MKIIKLKDLSKKDYRRIIERSFGTNESIKPDVSDILGNVKKNGDSVILEKYQERYGNDKYKSVQVTKDEIKYAYSKVDKQYLKSVRQMVKNITLVHKDQLKKIKDSAVKPEEGITVWREWRAIEKVGLYIPGGKSIYPSSVLMSGIPAKIAGCNEIIMCSPPREDGFIPSPTLVAADIIGVGKIFKIGGAEAIGAMAYGTQSVPKVYKIFGAGNSYVTCAKMLVFGEVAIDMPAGPSEVLIMADETANPAHIAADLLADSEHGSDSACVLLTTSKIIAEKTIKEIEKQIDRLSTKKNIRESLNKYGLIALVETLTEAIDYANKYAPEHLEIMTKNAESLVDKITNAGSIFLGNWTSKSAGDYATGANHVLPTGGMAKMYPPLGVDAYGKWMQVQKCTRNGLSRIKDTIRIIADIEGLPAHKNATLIRFH